MTSRVYVVPIAGPINVEAGRRFAAAPGSGAIVSLLQPDAKNLVSEGLARYATAAEIASISGAATTAGIAVGTVADTPFAAPPPETIFGAVADGTDPFVFNLPSAPTDADAVRVALEDGEIPTWSLSGSTVTVSDVAAGVVIRVKYR